MDACVFVDTGCVTEAGPNGFDAVCGTGLLKRKRLEVLETPRAARHDPQSLSLRGPAWRHGLGHGHEHAPGCDQEVTSSRRDNPHVEFGSCRHPPACTSGPGAGSIVPQSALQSFPHKSHREGSSAQRPVSVPSHLSAHYVQTMFPPAALMLSLRLLENASCLAASNATSMGISHASPLACTVASPHSGLAPMLLANGSPAQQPEGPALEPVHAPSTTPHNGCTTPPANSGFRLRQIPKLTALDASPSGRTWSVAGGAVDCSPASSSALNGPGPGPDTGPGTPTGTAAAAARSGFSAPLGVAPTCGAWALRLQPLRSPPPRDDTPAARQASWAGARGETGRVEGTSEAAALADTRAADARGSSPKGEDEERGGCGRGHGCSGAMCGCCRGVTSGMQGDCGGCRAALGPHGAGAGAADGPAAAHSDAAATPAATNPAALVQHAAARLQVGTAGAESRDPCVAAPTAPAGACAAVAAAAFSRAAARPAVSPALPARERAGTAAPAPAMAASSLRASSHTAGCPPTPIPSLFGGGGGGASPPSAVDGATLVENGSGPTKQMLRLWPLTHKQRPPPSLQLLRLQAVAGGGSVNMSPAPAQPVEPAPPAPSQPQPPRQPQPQPQAQSQVVHVTARVDRSYGEATSHGSHVRAQGQEQADAGASGPQRSARERHSGATATQNRPRLPQGMESWLSHLNRLLDAASSVMAASTATPNTSRAADIVAAAPAAAGAAAETPRQASHCGANAGTTPHTSETVAVAVALARSGDAGDAVQGQAQATVPDGGPAAWGQLGGLAPRADSPRAPRPEPEAFFEPDGSLLRGAVLQAACNIIRAAELPGGITVAPMPGRGGAGGAGGCEMSLPAALRLLTAYAGAAQALQRAHPRLLPSQMAAKAAAAAAAVAGAEPAAAAARRQEGDRALLPLMRRGWEAAQVVMAKVEKALQL